MGPNPTGTFSGGTVRASPESTATASFSFTGTAITWIGVKCDVRGEHCRPRQVGEPYFRAGVLRLRSCARRESHNRDYRDGHDHCPAILLVGGTHIAVDAFDVTR